MFYYSSKSFCFLFFSITPILFTFPPCWVLLFLGSPVPVSSHPHTLPFGHTCFWMRCAFVFCIAYPVIWQMRTSYITNETITLNALPPPCWVIPSIERIDWVMQCHDYLALEPAKLFKCPNIQLTRTDHRKLLHKLRSTQSGSGCSVTEVIVPAKVPPPKLERQSSLKTKLLQYKPNWSVSYTQDIKCDDVVLKVAMTAFVCGACSSVLCVCLFYVSHARVLLGSVCSLCYLCESCTSKGNILSLMCSLLISTCAISSRHFLCVYLLLLHFLDIRVPLGMLTVAQKPIAKKSLNLCSFFSIYPFSFTTDITTCSKTHAKCELTTCCHRELGLWRKQKGRRAAQNGDPVDGR